MSTKIEMREDTERELHYWNAIIIALFFGWFGLQEFYVKRYIAGIFAVLFYWTCIPAIVAFIEAIYWLFIGEDKFIGKHKETQDIFE